MLGEFPEHRLLAEEGSAAREPHFPGGFRWIADPLDGTTNYVHRVPHYAVSLALEHDGKVLVGAIFDPTSDNCFAAATGRGATLNGQPMQVSQVAALSGAIAATGFPAQVQRDSPELLVFNEAVFRCQGVRRTGSASLNLCYLAAGWFDVLWGFSTKVWDVAAGTLLVSEAGGIVSSPSGGDFVLEDAQYVAAATPALHAELLEMVRRAIGQQ